MTAAVSGNEEARRLRERQKSSLVFVISRIIKVEVGVISQRWRLRLITLAKTLIILDIKKTEISNNCFTITHWKQKLGSHVSASSLKASNTNHTKLTWLPLEILHCSQQHTWHDYLWPWVSLTWLLYNLQLWCHRCWFRKIHCMLSANQ